jgi:hypothetical protein
MAIATLDSTSTLRPAHGIEHRERPLLSGFVIVFPNGESQAYESVTSRFEPRRRSSRQRAVDAAEEAPNAGSGVGCRLSGAASTRRNPVSRILLTNRQLAGIFRD